MRNAPCGTHMDEAYFLNCWNTSTFPPSHPQKLCDRGFEFKYQFPDSMTLYGCRKKWNPDFEFKYQFEDLVNFFWWVVGVGKSGTLTLKISVSIIRFSNFFRGVGKSDLCVPCTYNKGMDDILYYPYYVPTNVPTNDYQVQGATSSRSNKLKEHAHAERTMRNAPCGTHHAERTMRNAPCGTHHAERTMRNAHELSQLSQN
jgi:hypothetical protein